VLVAPHGAHTIEEQDVAKHRGKRKRTKREMGDETALQMGGSGSAVAQAVPAAAEVDEETDESTPTAVVADKTSAANQSADDRSSRPEARERIESSNVIQFPKSSAVMVPSSTASVAAARSASSSDEDDARATLPSGTLVSGEVLAAPATTGSVAAGPVPEPAKQESKPTKDAAVAATPPATQDAAAAPAGKQGKAEPSTGARAAKEDPKEAARTPANRKLDTAAPSARDRKDSTGARDRKISFSGELSDEAKAFFQDKSYEAAYKTNHDTFEDLKPEDPPDHHRNRRSMWLAGALVAISVFVVGGVALQQRVAGVSEVQLPSVTAASVTPAPRPEAQPSGTQEHGTAAPTAPEAAPTGATTSAAAAAVPAE
jgi:hypothetical protein